jgi:hypothetical protein
MSLEFAHVLRHHSVSEGLEPPPSDASMFVKRPREVLISRR